MEPLKQSGEVAPDAARLNREWFSVQSNAEFIEGAPHLKHPRLRNYCQSLAREVFDKVARDQKSPLIFDMGAGNGTLTVPYLEWGARVTAADVTVEFLESLRARSRAYEESLTVMPGDIFKTVAKLSPNSFDVVCASAFLHHIPDYLELCRQACRLIRPHGVFFTFQDPLRYDTLSGSSHFMERVGYFWWRIFQGDYLRGLKTRWRRVFGVYRADLAEDTAEYHVVRNGVDHVALQQLLQAEGFDCEIRSYWSTQSSLFQAVGAKLNLVSNFALLARRMR